MSDFSFFCLQKDSIFLLSVQIFCEIHNFLCEVLNSIILQHIQEAQENNLLLIRILGDDKKLPVLVTTNIYTVLKLIINYQTSTFYVSQYPTKLKWPGRMQST